MSVPPRAEWPELPGASPEGTVLTELVLTTFRLNARLLEAAQHLAAHGEITAAWWQVLGGVLDEPRSVAEIGRRMGLTRQGVRRVADLLVERGLARWEATPAHRGVKLLACTEAGYWAIRRIGVAQHPWADAVGRAVGLEQLEATLAGLRALLSTLDRR